MNDFPLLTDMIERFRRYLGASAYDTATSRPWVNRGVISAVRCLGIVSPDEAEAVAVFSLAYEQGAIEASRFTRIILSDPAVRGRELEALKLIELGLGHSAIVAALHAEPATTPTAGPVVVPFTPRGGR